jgi:dihydrofolate reductase
MNSSERGSDVVASLAVTLDGFIARPDGSVDYLDKYPMADFDFDAWIDRVGAVVMGRSSYETTVGFGWGLGKRPTLVLTTATDLEVPEGANVTFQAAPTAEVIRTFSAETPGRLWVFGGGAVVTAALLGGAIDVLDITMVPEAIGAGIPLFAEAFPGPMKLVQAVPYANGAVRLVYEIDNAA